MKKLFFFLALTVLSFLSFSNNLLATSISQEEYNVFDKQTLNEISPAYCAFLAETKPKKDLPEFAHLCQQIADYVSTSLFSSFGWDAEDAIMIGELVEDACCELISGC